MTAGQQRGDIRPPDVLRDFSFTRPQRRMNWQLLGGVDIDDIARRGDVRPVLAALDDVAGCSVYGDGEDCRQRRSASLVHMLCTLT